MNKKSKPNLRQRQSTQQLMGIKRITEHGVLTLKGEQVFYLVSPDNLSVLSPEGVLGRIRALSELLRGIKDVTLRALDSRESYEQNQTWYQERAEKEANPALRELLLRDRKHLDEIQTMTASTREFLLACSLACDKGENPETEIARKAKAIADYGFRVRVADESDVKRILSVYYQQESTTANEIGEREVKTEHDE